MVSALVRVRSASAADDSLADILACNRLGMAIAAIMRIIATTISNSINENPFAERISFPQNWLPKVGRGALTAIQLQFHRHSREGVALSCNSLIVSWINKLAAQRRARKSKRRVAGERVWSIFVKMVSAIVT